MRKLIFGVALLSATALSAIPLAAQDRGRGDAMVVTPNQVVDLADAKIAQLKADLRLTADQDKNWGGLSTALHDMAVRRSDRMKAAREQRASMPVDATAPATSTTTTAPVTDPATRPRDDRDSRDMRADRDRDRDRDRAPDIVADMRKQADELAAKSDDFRKFADAAGPLYTSLDDSQKGRFLAFTQRNMIDDPAQLPPPPRGRGRDRY